MSYRFHEIRKGECGQAIAFAAGHGSKVSAGHLRHHLSLAVEAEGQMVAVALSVENQPNHFVIEIIVGEGITDEALLTELADRCLRKVQAQAIASVRLHSPTAAPTQTIWTQSSWLDKVQETPPGPDAPAKDPAQAA